MKKVMTLAMLLLSIKSFSQKKTNNISDTLNADQVNEIIKKAMPDDDGLLRESSEKACTCISKIKIKNKSQEDISKSISACIEKEYETYSMMKQMMGVLGNGKNSDTIYMGDAKKHDHYYFEIENWLRDSCASLKGLLETNNKESEHSMTSNKKALAYYKKGQAAAESEAWEDGVTYFSKAVAEDPGFSFGWDNLGICLRRSGKNPEAIEAYNKSLEIDPKGVTPLQNLPVVYNILKDYDKAIQSYLNLVRIYPDNPEGYFGAGQVYIYGKEDLEKGLDYMCKAYNIYTKIGSPYRSDAQKIISYIYGEMKKQNKEDLFNRILKDNNISTQ